MSSTKVLIKYVSCGDVCTSCIIISTQLTTNNNKGITIENQEPSVKQDFHQKRNFHSYNFMR